MKITVLGCNGPFPAANAATSGYLIEHDGKYILMDCGAGVAGKLLQYIQPSQLEAVLFSHLHFDHMSDVAVLGYWFEVNSGVLPVYIPAEEKTYLRELVEKQKKLEVHEHQDAYELAGIRIETSPVNHPVACRALRLTAGGKTFVFTGDTNECDTLPAFCRDADLIMADSAFPNEIWAPEKPHMSPALCAKLAAQANAKQLCLTHMNPSVAPEKLVTQAKEIFPNTFSAYPGLTIEL